MNTMSCPRCGSTNMWGDYASSGCNNCGYAVLAGQPSLALAKDPGELPVALRERVRQFDERRQAYHDADVRRDSECAF